MAELTAVGRADDVPEGEMRQYQVGGEDVAVASVDGELHAFSDVCTHRQCSLSEGDLDGTTVTCPCHGSEFDVTSGDVLAGPAVEPVQTFEVAVDDGELKIGL
jgi:nitrite reductase/ring-hydroxylating ferredoxin subunit